VTGPFVRSRGAKWGPRGPAAPLPPRSLQSGGLERPSRVSDAGKSGSAGGKWCKRRFVKFPDASEFNKRYQLLLSAAKAADNDACIECHGCTACARSTFCRDSEHLTGCHYCVRSRFSTNCSHCRDSSRLVGCHHCIESEECTSCRYVTRSRGLTNCTYCFGCVGLSGKDFHILNQPYSRKDYFELVDHLSRLLRVER
jgi:hypothetical protein